MSNETAKLLLTYLTALIILLAGFGSLVLYPYELDDLVKGAIIALMTLAAQHVFADSAATRVGRQQQVAFDSGMTTAKTGNGQPP